MSDDDLREGIEGLRDILGGTAKVRRAGESLLNKADRVLDHLTRDDTVRRVAGAALASAIEATGAEIREAAGASGTPAQARARSGGRGKSLGIACSRHGRQPWSTWRQTIVCTADGCGRVYQTINPYGAHFAPGLCACGARLLPPAPDQPAEPSSAQPFCSPCFDEVVAAGGRATRNPEE
jgi:hypothetical protein